MSCLVVWLYYPVKGQTDNREFFDIWYPDIYLSVNRMKM